ncbi:MAG: hypothetical protein ACLTXR_01905 [Clostridia bacterium]
MHITLKNECGAEAGYRRGIKYLETRYSRFRQNMRNELKDREERPEMVEIATSILKCCKKEES